MLTRWDPYREMSNFRRMMNRMFEEPMYSSAEWDENVWDLPVDVMENEDGYVVKASIPGVNPDDLEITYNNNTLTIRGEINKEEEHQDKEGHYLVHERRYGTIMRSIALPVTVNSGAIEASYDAGILTLQLPKTEEVKPRRIQIHGGNKMIEGSAKSEQSKSKQR
jgi:HSP20 family protein